MSALLSAAEFPVQPLFTFTRVDDPTDVRTLDTGLAGSDPFSLSSGNRSWVHDLGSSTLAAPCGQNFVPGVQEDPETGAQCCFPICHLADVPAHHCVVVDVTCPCCPTGACCDPTDGTCTVVEGSPPEGPCPEVVCIETGGVYLGDNTDCSDGDGDGLADILETGGSGDCCGFDPSNSCDVGTDASNPDSDGDGCLDGEEVEGGADPCDPCDAVAGCLAQDCNNNGVADECETDTDGDGVIDACDNCPSVSNPDQANSDPDSHGDACDNCPDLSNEDQADSDGDGRGNGCDSVIVVIARRTCGAGLCGAGGAAMLPVILLGLGLIKFGVARNRRGRG